MLLHLWISWELVKCRFLSPTPADIPNEQLLGGIRKSAFEHPLLPLCPRDSDEGGQGPHSKKCAVIQGPIPQGPVGSGLLPRPFCSSGSTGNSLSCSGLASPQALLQTFNRCLLNVETSLPGSGRVYSALGTRKGVWVAIILAGKIDKQINS